MWVPPVAVVAVVAVDAAVLVRLGVDVQLPPVSDAQAQPGVVFPVQLVFDAPILPDVGAQLPPVSAFPLLLVAVVRPRPVFVARLPPGVVVLGLLDSVLDVVVQLRPVVLERLAVLGLDFPVVLVVGALIPLALTFGLGLSLPFQFSLALLLCFRLALFSLPFKVSARLRKVNR